MNQFKDSYIIGGLPFQMGKNIDYHKYKHPKIAEILNRYNIKNIKDLTSDNNSDILSEKIIERLFVKDFLDIAIKDYNIISPSPKGEPDFIIEKDKKAFLTTEVYAPSFTKKVLEAATKSKDGTLTYSSTTSPLHSKTIKNKINKYSGKYPYAKQCLFLFFVDYLNEKNVMRAFNNFYGDTMHANGALVHNSKEGYCIKEDMEKVAGFFMTEGHLNIRDATLEYRDVIFAHNPFCLSAYSLPFTFFDSKTVFQSYIEFIGKKPTRDNWWGWGKFLKRFYKNNYPDYLFLEDDINYCKQVYPHIVSR